MLKMKDKRWIKVVDAEMTRRRRVDDGLKESSFSFRC
jgi:hypothetical protein